MGRALCASGEFARAQVAAPRPAPPTAPHALTPRRSEPGQLRTMTAITSPPPSRTKWTRRVPHPVLIGHAALTPAPPSRHSPLPLLHNPKTKKCPPPCRTPIRLTLRYPAGRARPCARRGGERPRQTGYGSPAPAAPPPAPPPPPLVQSGHASSLTPYQMDTPRPSPRTNRTRRVPHPY